MAVLSSDTLSGCSSIPSFLGGSADTPSNPTVSVFRNTNAPLNWVKKTTHNDKALRIIGGANGTALSPGGTSTFTTILSPSKPVSSPGSFGPNTSGVGAAGPSPSNTTNSGNAAVQASTNAYFPTTTEMAAHAHPHDFYNPTLNSAGPLAYGTIAAAFSPTQTAPSNPNGGQFHTHLINIPHTHTFSDSGHTHPFSSEAAHTHSFSITAQNFAVTYVDIIIATKS